VAARICTVSFADASGIVHSVEVAAESLFEAAALAIQEFRRAAIVETVPGPATTLTVAVKAPATEHTVTIRQLRNWMDGLARSPKERMVKDRIREIVGR
jgi:hypothetical protein